MNTGCRYREQLHSSHGPRKIKTKGDLERAAVGVPIWGGRSRDRGKEQGRSGRSVKEKKKKKGAAEGEEKGAAVGAPILGGGETRN
ncbi:hypothetical protein FIBSPDRAFT_856114 [Athelia psychrophila]|uniref:Uncharacterized protein n=1 Tax=Athelia psychrophila TaxID=1759441 RepID=A0A166NM96_9AGAM|nr:hypothetical protein FIBSPDRAFT_856114 [Fibularhizoctonia sp. CBS 109695]